ncbi:hypothetical protein QAD02_015414, partial [Eretmocerus hayati]
IVDCFQTLNKIPELTWLFRICLVIIHVACSAPFRLPGFYLYMVLLSLYSAFGVWDIIVVSSDLETCMNDFIPVLGLVSIVINSFGFYTNRRTLETMIKEVYDDWFSVNISKSSHVVIEKNIKIARIVSYLVMAGYGFIGISLPLKAVVSYLIHDVNGREYVLPAAFPWEGRQSPTYELITITQFLACSSGVYCCAVFEGQLAFLVLHACSKVHIVREEIAMLSQSSQESSSEYLNTIIKRISRKHSEFLKFSENLEDAFSLISFVHVTGLTLILVFAGFTVMVAVERRDPVAAINYIVFLLAFLLTSVIYCYAGEYLTNQSDTIVFDIAYCPWYDFPLIYRKHVHFMLMRAQVPVTLTAGKFNQLSLVLLSSVSHCLNHPLKSMKQPAVSPAVV